MALAPRSTVDTSDKPARIGLGCASCSREFGCGHGLFCMAFREACLPEHCDRRLEFGPNGILGLLDFQRTASKEDLASADVAAAGRGT